MVKNSIIVFYSNEWEELYNGIVGDKDEAYKADLVLHSIKTGEEIPVVMLRGSLDGKIKKIKEFTDNVSKNQYNRKIAIYGGTIPPELRDIALKFNITLCHKIILNHTNMSKIIEVPASPAEKTIHHPDSKYDKIQRREKIFIVKEILDTVNSSDGINITKIIYRCNLNYQYAIKLLENLIQKGMVDVMEYKNGIKYAITSEGKNYLNELKSL
jgi:predicted transcriptional regulator